MTWQVSGSFKAKSVRGASEDQLRSWLKKWTSHPLLWFDRTYQRFTRLDDADADAAFDAALRDGLRPAPKLRAIVYEVVRRLRARVLSGAGFNCLQLSHADLERNGPKVFTLAARKLNARAPTLLADAALDVTARTHMRTSFHTPLFLDELLPNGTRALLLDDGPNDEGPTEQPPPDGTGSDRARDETRVDGRAGARGTSGTRRFGIAYELVEFHVCAAADDFGGNMLTPYAHAVCNERDGVLPSSLTAAGPALQVKDGRVRKQCRDVYGREAEILKSSRAGSRGWF
jgi:hypothetical protein